LFDSFYLFAISPVGSSHLYDKGNKTFELDDVEKKFGISPADQYGVKLGNTYQSFVSLILDRCNIEHDYNEPYTPYYREVDIAIPNIEKPEMVVFVTHSKTHGMSNRKFWRDIEETSELKSHFGPAVRCIALLFGPHIEAHQKGNQQALERIFDKIVPIQKYEDGRTLDDALAYAVSKDLIRGRDVVTQKKSIEAFLFSKKETQRALDSFQTSFMNEIRDVPLKLKELWKEEYKFYRKRLSSLLKIMRTFLYPSINWKKGVLKAFIAGKDGYDTITAPGKSSVHSSTLRRLLDLEFVSKADKSISSIHGTSGLIVDSDLLHVYKRYDWTVLSDLLDSCLSERSDLRQLILDVWYPTRLKKMVDLVVERLANNGFEFLQQLIIENFEDEKYQGVDSSRLWVFDVALILSRLTQNKLDAELVKKFGRSAITIRHPVGNIILRTKLVRSFKRDIEEILSYLSKSLISHLKTIWGTPTDINRDDIFLALLRFRRNQILAHQAFNPLDIMVRNILQQASLQFSSRYCPSFISDLPDVPRNVGRTKIPFFVERPDRNLIIKTVAAHKAGASSKADEMSGRIRAMRHHRNEKPFSSILVIDGEWEEPHVGCLFLAGWDHLCTLDNFKVTLEKVTQN